MKRAQHIDRATIVDILVNSFRDNKSVNYIIQQDSKKELRLRRLMEYSHDVCKLYGDVFITEDKASCALIVKPDKKRTSNYHYRSIYDKVYDDIGRCRRPCAFCIRTWTSR